MLLPTNLEQGPRIFIHLVNPATAVACAAARTKDPQTCIPLFHRLEVPDEVASNQVSGEGLFSLRQVKSHLKSQVKTSP